MSVGEVTNKYKVLTNYLSKLFKIPAFSLFHSDNLAQMHLTYRRMKKILPVLFCVLTPFLVDAQYLQWNSLIEENASSSSTIDKSFVHSSGKIFISGSFNGTIDLDPHPIATFNLTAQAGSNKNLFLGRYNSDGELENGFHIQGKTDMAMGGFDLDMSNNMYVTGSFNDTIDLNLGSGLAYYSPSVGGAEDVFLVKYSSQGVFQLARQIKSSVFTRSSDMALDMNGDIVVAGIFKGNTDFDPSSSSSQFRSSIEEDIFIARYNSSGNYQNVITIGSSPATKGKQEVANLEIDNSNDIYITGRFQGDVDFDPGPGTTILTAVGTNDFYIAKYNSNLQLMWAHSFGGPSEEGEIDHKLRGSDLWITGSFKDSIDLNFKSGVAPHISNGSFDVFYARYDLSANLNLSKSFGSSGLDEALSLSVNEDDSVLISGHFQGTVDFDPSTSSSKTLTASSSKSLFFASYDQNADLNWVSRIVGTGDVESSHIHSNQDGEIILLGHLKGNADFNDVSPFNKNFSGPASFIANYGKCGRVDIDITKQHATCGTRDGSATAIVTGGSLPLRYKWTSGHITSSADSLRAGMYYLTVTDTLNCQSVSEPVLINETGGPSVSLDSKTNVTCNGESNGAISVNVSGGKTPYTFLWSNGKKSQNISNVGAGVYEITVTDDDGCKSFLRETVSEPNALAVFPKINRPTCGNSNGSIVVAATGGTPIYSYSWQPSGSGSTLSGISSGVYTVTVTDGNSCTHSQSIAVSDINAPDIFLDSVQSISCGSGGGGIYVSVVGGMPGYNYLWTPGNYSSQDINGVPGDNYKLEVTDNSTCKAYFTQALGSKKPTAPEVCIVDVDSNTGNAVVVWEKPTSRGSIDYYSVYRETSVLNVFDLVEDSIDFGELSLCEDLIADTWTRPWSYKISLTDTCGVKSDLSSYHTTIHAVITKNAQQHFNVLWTPYKGNFFVGSYAVYRYTDTTGTADLVATLPSNIFSFTDVNSPSKGSDVYYFVQVVHPDGCTATEAQNRNSSRSNRGSLSPPNYDMADGIDFNRENLELFNLYPNPASNEFNLDFVSNISSTGTITLYSMEGKEIWTEGINVIQGSQQHSFYVGDIPPGIFIVQINIAGDLHRTKLIKTDKN